MKLQGLRRTVALTLVATVFSLGIVKPRPARAIDTAFLVLGSIAAYAAVVGVATWLWRRNTTSSWGLMPMDERLRDQQPEPGLHLANHCTQDDRNLKLVCW